MKDDKYLQASKNLAFAIDLAIESIRKYPREIWDENTLNRVVGVYLEFKAHALDTNPKYRTLKSLTSLVNDVLIYFQENEGKDVDEFWEQVKKHSLPYFRENKLIKILKQKKIKNRIEYDFVIDTLLPYQQDGLISNEEAGLLNTYVEAFENKNKKRG